MIATIGALIALGVTLPIRYAFRMHTLRGRVHTLLPDRIRARGLTLEAGDKSLDVLRTGLVPGAGPIFWLGCEHPPLPSASALRLSELIVRDLRGTRLRLFSTSDAGRWLDSSGLASAFARLFPLLHWQLAYEYGHMYLYAGRVGSADLEARLRGIAELDVVLGTVAQGS